MNSNNWQQIETIFHAALELGAAERRAYLARTCAGNARLFDEVESLITAFGAADFLEDPAFELGLDVIRQRGEEDLSGLEIGSYRIVEKLGAGGMGEVYLADDLNLDRQVALKFLSGILTDDARAKQQLISEARAVAALDHPNICPVYRIEEISEHHFIVMQYCKGATLDHFVKNESPDIKTILNIARQIVGAIADAHSHDIIHCDIKPRNLIVAPNNQVKVLDFGVAKIIRKNQRAKIAGEDNQSPRDNLIVGTISYMSPEQMRGEKLDFRADVFSIGIVLYEMLGGHNPFYRSSRKDAIDAILHEEPAPLKNLRADIAPAVSDAVMKCLYHDREKRFLSAVELLDELEKIEEKRIANRSPLINYTATAFLFLLIAAVGLFLYLRPAVKIPTLAILPIRNESGESAKDYLGDGLTDNLTGGLSRISNLKIKAATLVAKYKDQPADPQIVGSEITTDTVLQGKIVRNSENILLLDVNLIETGAGKSLWSDEFVLDENQLVTIRGKIAAAVVAALKPDFSEQDRKNLNVYQTTDAEALRLYYLGRYYWSKRDSGDNLRKAIENFTAAKERDPSFARAWAGLADTYVLYSIPGYDNAVSPAKTINLARAAAKKALEFDPDSSEAYVSLAMIKLLYEWDWQGAETLFQQAILLAPDNAAAHYGYSNLLVINHRFDQAFAEAAKAKELDPFSPNADLNFARIYYFEENFTESTRIFAELSEKYPTSEKFIYSLGLQYLAMNRTPEAIAIFEKLYARETNSKLLVAGALGYAYGKTGKTAEARRILAELENLAKNKYVSQQEIALIYLGLDERDKAFENLSAACTEKFPSFPYLVIDPLLDKFRADSRYALIRNCARL